jgi:hypothetical protein
MAFAAPSCSFLLPASRSAAPPPNPLLPSPDMFSARHGSARGAEQEGASGRREEDPVIAPSDTYFAAVHTGNPILQLVTAVGTIALLIRSTQGK